MFVSSNESSFKFSFSNIPKSSSLSSREVPSVTMSADWVSDVLVLAPPELPDDPSAGPPLPTVSPEPPEDPEFLLLLLLELLDEPDVVPLLLSPLEGLESNPLFP